MAAPSGALEFAARGLSSNPASGTEGRPHAHWAQASSPSTGTDISPTAHLAGWVLGHGQLAAGRARFRAAVPACSPQTGLKSPVEREAELGVRELSRPRPGRQADGRATQSHRPGYCTPAEGEAATQAERHLPKSWTCHTAEAPRLFRKAPRTVPWGSSRKDRLKPRGWRGLREADRERDALQCFMGVHQQHGTRLRAR